MKLKINTHSSPRLKSGAFCGTVVKPEQARTVLPNSLKTEIVATMNLRSWRNFFNLMTDITAHPEMRELSIPLLAEFKKQIPFIFDDINK